MRLDNDLVRLMLLQLEEDADANFLDRVNDYCLKKFPNHELAQTEYHMKYLIDAGFVQTTSDKILIRDITPAGRDFLNNVRDEAVWGQTKDALKKTAGAVTLDVISTIAASIIKQSLGLS